MANPFTFFKKVCNRLLTIIELTRKADPYLRHRHTRAPRLPRKLCKPAGLADGDLSPEKGEGDPGLPKLTRNRVCERGRRGRRRRGGEGEKPEGTEQRGGTIRPAVFSVQPRSDKTQVFSFKTKKKKKKYISQLTPRLNTLTTHNIFQTRNSGAQTSPTNMHTRDK